MPRILLGVSASVAAYKALEFIRLATAAGHAVRVIQTPASRRFVEGASFVALTGAPVLSDEFERDPARGAFPDQRPPEHEPIGHLELVRNADLYLIAPASANTIAKLAHGHAENLLTSCALAAECPILIAPAMNDRMYLNPATRANLELLSTRGATIIDPTVGRLASKGEQGIGRLAEPEELLRACHARLELPSNRSWRDTRVLVTAGGTREPIDSVRFLGNSSSGRMGLALARAAHDRGAQVTVIAANVALERPPGIAWREVTTAAELQQACEEEFPACEVLLMAAAVADFRPAEPARGKIKKSTLKLLTLELERTADVLSSLAATRRPGQTLVGFAAEHGDDAVGYGLKKLQAKGLDAVVVNDISRPDIGFEADFNEVTILTSSGEQSLARAAKAQIAEGILDAVERLRG
jgi:phosphopantothenoylcysteine decarboxylase/phosphopantothenate--cysteine ligase